MLSIYYYTFLSHPRGKGRVSCAVVNPVLDAVFILDYPNYEGRLPIVQTFINAIFEYIQIIRLSLTLPVLGTNWRWISKVILLLTLGRTVLRESDDLDILGVTFDSMMTFKIDLHSVPRAGSQRFFTWGSPWQVFNCRLLLLKCFQSSVLPTLEYCSAVWCSATNSHLNCRQCQHNLLSRQCLSSASFLNGGVLGH